MEASESEGKKLAKEGWVLRMGRKILFAALLLSCSNVCGGQAGDAAVNRAAPLRHFFQNVY
jgi:hypothetical protein